MKVAGQWRYLYRAVDQELATGVGPHLRLVAAFNKLCRLVLDEVRGGRAK